MKARAAAASLLLLLAVPAAAQEPATVTGRVTNQQGRPENAVDVRIPHYNVGARSSPDGSYRIVVPASRIRAGQAVTITASRVGLSTTSRSIALGPGSRATQDFQLPPDFLRRGSKPCKKSGGRPKC